MKVLEMIGALLLVGLIVYLFWQSVLVRQALLEERRNKRERPISIFDDKEQN